MWRLKKFHPSTFQMLVKAIEMVGGQFNVDARSLPRCRSLRSERIGTIVDQQADRSARWPADADHRKLWSFVDLNRKAELVSIKFDRMPNVCNAERESFQSNVEGITEFRSPARFTVVISEFSQ